MSKPKLISASELLALSRQLESPMPKPSSGQTAHSASPKLPAEITREFLFQSNGNLSRWLKSIPSLEDRKEAVQKLLLQVYDGELGEKVGVHEVDGRIHIYVPHKDIGYWISRVGLLKNEVYKQEIRIVGL